MSALVDLLHRWGFREYGVKRGNGKEEKVLVKKMNCYDNSMSIKENFPNVNYRSAKRILPIYAKYHTNLMPDSSLKSENEVELMANVAHRYALQKVYVTWGMKGDVRRGDIVLFYRIGEAGTRKAYTSLLTTVAIIDGIYSHFENKEQFMKCCNNRSVFSNDELEDFWDNHSSNLCVVEFIYVKNLCNKLNLKYLWDNKIVTFPEGPRPFVGINESQFDRIISDSNTELYGVGD